MIENRSRRWSFQFIILPLLRDDSSALKLLLGRRRSWEVRSNADGTTRTRGEKLLFSESPPASLTPPHTSSSTPTTFMDKLRGGRKRPSTSPGKVLTIFRQGSSPQLLRSRAPVCHGEVGELTMRRASYELTLVAFVPVLEYAKRARLYIYPQSGCLQCTSGGTKNIHTLVIVIFLERNYISVKFSTSVLSSKIVSKIVSCPKIVSSNWTL